LSSLSSAYLPISDGSSRIKTGFPGLRLNSTGRSILTVVQTMGSSATTVVQEARDITAGKREQTKEEFTNAINAVRFFTEPKVSVYQ
jgi:hypothetical protein